MSAQPETAAAAPRSGRRQPRRFAGWSEHHGWSLAASLRRLAGRPLGTLLTVAVMGLALSLPLAFYLFLANVQSMGDALGQHPAIGVFLKVDQAGPQAELLASKLRDRADVAAVTLKSPQQGLDELAAMQGFSGALHALDDHNPLPYALQVEPRPGLDAAAVGRLVGELREERAVDMVQDSARWRQRLDALLALGHRIVLVLAGLLVLAALLVVGNTVRVDIASRSEEIGVLLLLGASRAFVRRPYLYAGIWYGLFGGALAALLALGIELALAQPVAQLTQAYEGRLHVGGLPLWLLLAVPPATALLGWLGARLVSAWQLRRAA
ncbi:permease-like cell division protein FtsX [Frateuria defendens]|uniref:permease-like cell division protein FtsX n=1 Tax=Frateuria defendens TaxID=2219559 RepID=UPI00066FD4FD|nr:permease-like cell division protein FtsX [Frateuria defendens]